MSNSYRIRTTPGVDKNINVLIDQDFEYLEILSLKILQSDVYSRPCSDYGVAVGRVSVNGGFGIPNAKISIFIPLTTEDESNPVISTLYPYKNLRTINEDGYRYNLLPYKKSYSGHVPTGTFFTREDVLTDSTLIEVYDKYYRYTTTTNESGDYMIFGVPVGAQTIIADIDLSDIGEFSLSPQDLIRMGVATSSQVSGTKFKSSSNLTELPQIINIRKSIQVVPLWGQPDVCQLGISRRDFDLSNEAKIDITPTAIFMGSIISTSDEDYVKKNGKPSLKSGYLCNLIAGPGEILAIRQTIFQDSSGKPILESIDLEQGGQVIDGDGTWLLDVPMNLDYVTTNEFGERVLSSDPKIGIPTKAKYRFKVKWNQSPSLSEPTKRGYFLVPNIREHGWDNNNTKPLNVYNPLPESNYQRAVKSYSFSLDWNDYGNQLTSTGQIDTIGQQMIQDAIDCKDTFYMMQYNKVYTVSQMIDQYRKGFLPERFTGIKDILNTECNGDINKFPTNDTVFRFDLIYILFYLFLHIIKPILIVMVPVVHILAFTIFLLGIVLSIIIAVIAFVVLIMCYIVQFLAWAVCAVSFGSYCKDLNCDQIIDGAREIINFLTSAWKKLLNLKIPNIAYPECNLCECGDAGSLNNVPSDSSTGVDVTTAVKSMAESGGNTLLSLFEISVFYKIKKKNPNGSLNPNYTSEGFYESLMGGSGLGSEENDNLTPKSRVPVIVPFSDNGTSNGATHFFSDSLPLHERMNLFNNKAKYFDNNSNNPGGSVNRIKVSFSTDLPPNSGKFHYDNVIALVCQPNALSVLKPGTILSFQDLTLTKDVNLKRNSPLVNQYGNNSITGTPINLYASIPAPLTVDTSVYSTNKTGVTQNFYSQIVPTDINISYANPSSPGVNLNTSYKIIQDMGVKAKKLPRVVGQPPKTELTIVYTGTNTYAKFPTDVEYFQVITAMTYSNYVNICTGTTAPIPTWSNMTLFKRFLNNDMQFYRIEYNQDNSFEEWCDCPFCVCTAHRFSDAWTISDGVLIKPMNYFIKSEKQVVTFLVRGVDPNSSRQQCSYDLSRMFGFDFGAIPPITGKFKLNQPIMGGYNNVRHDIGNNAATDLNGNKLYYKSFSFLPTSTGNFSFSSFTSNLVSLYSKLDLTNLTFNPSDVTSNPKLSDVIVSSSSVARIKSPISASVAANHTTGSFFNYYYDGKASGSNGFTSNVEYTNYQPDDSNPHHFPLFQTPPSYPSNNNQTNNTNSVSTPVRGYFVNEIVEGGSAMYTQYLFIYYGGGNSSTPFGPSVQDFVKGFYYSPKYSTGTTINISDSTNIVMRSDRLPTSNVLQDNLNNSFLLQSNTNFAMYSVSDDGGISPLNANGGGNGLSPSGPNTDLISGATNPIPTSINTAIESFSCGNMAPLGCYYTTAAGEFGVQTKDNGCWRAPGGGTLFDGGCYILITTMFESLFRDIELIVEWVARLEVIFGACRDVWSHLFVNNWINGTLYAFSFKNYITYDSNNKPHHQFADEIVMLHPTTNNFFYRSSPYKDDGSGGGEFVGADYHNHAGNWNQTLFPTTILDMGPRNDYMQEIVMSDEFDGYVVNKLSTTTFGDVSELLNLFIISRLTRTSFLEELIGFQGASILSYFSRANLFGDGDYSQTISINSEFGVAPFEANNYLDLNPVPIVGGGTYNPQDPIYVAPQGDSQDVVFGIFFDSDTQVRDYITPKRTIINPNTVVGSTSCAFNNFYVFNQEVPFYQWIVNQNFTSPNIFGTQENDWDSGVPFLTYKYQNLDRLVPASKYFRTTNNSHTSNFKGYIYSVKDTTLNILTGTPPNQTTIPYTFMENNPNANSWSQTDGSNSILTGAPFFFYFGLKTGKSAFDRFAVKWLDTTTTIY